MGQQAGQPGLSAGRTPSSSGKASIYWLLPMCQVLQALCSGLDNIISLDPGHSEVKILLFLFADGKTEAWRE